MSGVIAVGHNGMNAFPFLFKPSLKAVHEQQEDETTDLKNFGHFHRDESPRLGPSDIRHYELHKGSVFTEHRYVYHFSFDTPTVVILRPHLSVTPDKLPAVSISTACVADTKRST